MARATVLLLGLVLLLAGMVSAQETGAKVSPKAYRLAPGDEVAVSVSPQKNYDTAGIILPDGFVYLRKIGKVRAAGLTLDELTAQVKKILDQDLNEPDVLVTLSKMAPPPMKEPEKIGRVTIVGAVGKTGPLDLEEGLRVRKALDLAGGTAKDADLANILIIHQDLTRTLVDLSTADRVSDPAHNRVLKDGDSVQVKALPEVVKVIPMVRIRGQVLTPGQYELKPNMTLEDLIIGAGKLSTLADVEHVQLQSPGDQIRMIDLVQQQKLGLKGKVFLKEGDEVFIPEHENRVMVVGAIMNPGPRSLQEGQKVRDFLLTSGDATAFNPAQIHMDGVQIIRRGMDPIKIDLRSVLKKEDHKDNLALQSGDLLWLPPKKEPKAGPLQYLGGLSSIGFLFGLF
jgi:protein involved in polysaccharide export with SLBB domain